MYKELKLSQELFSSIFATIRIGRELHLAEICSDVVIMEEFAF